MATVGAVAAVLGAGAAVYSASQSGKNVPKMPEIQQEKPVQASKGPDVSGIKRQTGQGLAAGPASTLLTGSSGIDTGSLNLGKNTLLGG